MTLKEIGYGALGIGIVGLIFFGKYKLARSGAVWWALILGGLVFAISTPVQTSEQ